MNTLMLISSAAGMSFGQWIGSGADFGMLITAIGNTFFPLAFMLWVARWIYNILMEISNENKR